MDEVEEYTDRNGNKVYVGTHTHLYTTEVYIESRFSGIVIYRAAGLYQAVVCEDVPEVLPAPVRTKKQAIQAIVDATAG